MSLTLLPVALGQQTVDTGDTGAGTGSDRTEDRDGDGWSPADGDCWDDPDDPDARTVHPDAAESCADNFDNDCNGMFNDGCSNPIGYATLQGGGCAAVGFPTAAWHHIGLTGLSLLALARRRRS